MSVLVLLSIAFVLTALTAVALHRDLRRAEQRRLAHARHARQREQLSRFAKLAGLSFETAAAQASRALTAFGRAAATYEPKHRQ